MSSSKPPSVYFLISGLILGMLLSNSAITQEEDDDVAGRQAVDAFISIEDGQPGGPGEWELAIEFGWEKARHVREPEEEGSVSYRMETEPTMPRPIETEETEAEDEDRNAYEAEYELKYTGKGSHFRENMKLSLTQGAELGKGLIDGNGDAELNWQQRWATESGRRPTLATLLTLRLPTGLGATGVDLTLTGILDKDLGPGTFYFSAWGTLADDERNEGIREFQWGAQAGYKWRVLDRFALYANYVYKSSEDRGGDKSNILELAAQYEVNERLILGPGILIGLDDHDETPEFGAGLKMTIPF